MIRKLFNYFRNLRADQSHRIRQGNVRQNTSSNERDFLSVDDYAQIDITRNTLAINKLVDGTSPQILTTIQKIQSEPDIYAPYVFYNLSFVLYSQNKTDEAAFWFCAGQLRSRFDANRSNDPSAGEVVRKLNESFGNPIKEQGLKDIPKLIQMVHEVVSWDRKTPHNYDQRWINQHDAGAKISALQIQEGKGLNLSRPENEWPDIAEETRKNYLKEFYEVLEGYQNNR